jgi:hypothetical protein
MGNNFCRLDWCARPSEPMSAYCRYHWNKIPLENKKNIRYSRYSTQHNGYLSQADIYLTTEHETIVDCPKCKGRGVNKGHSSYLRGKTCSWCNNGKRPKIS